MSISAQQAKELQDRVKGKKPPVKNKYTAAEYKAEFIDKTPIILVKAAPTIDLITFEIVPIGKPRMTQRDKWLNPPRKPVAAYWAFKESITAQAKQANFRLPDTFKAVFIIPMPQSWSRKKRSDMDGKPHQNKPDIDNITKAVLDCLKEQDCTVHSVMLSKYWGQRGMILISRLG